jgi:hypothetical protein
VVLLSVIKQPPPPHQDSMGDDRKYFCKWKMTLNFLNGGPQVL